MGLQIKLVKSIAGSSERQLATISGLGLKKFGDVKLLKNTESIRGMVFKVKHLVESTEVKEEPKLRKRMKPRAVRNRDAARAAAEKK